MTDENVKIVGIEMPIMKKSEQQPRVTDIKMINYCIRSSLQHCIRTMDGTTHFPPKNFLISLKTLHIRDTPMLTHAGLDENAFEIQMKSQTNIFDRRNWICLGCLSSSSRIRRSHFGLTMCPAKRYCLKWNYWYENRTLVYKRNHKPSEAKKLVRSVDETWRSSLSSLRKSFYTLIKIGSFSFAVCLQNVFFILSSPFSDPKVSTSINYYSPPLKPLTLRIIFLHSSPLIPPQKEKEKKCKQKRKNKEKNEWNLILYPISGLFVLENKRRRFEKGKTL